jgi:hypothetical protein
MDHGRVEKRDVSWFGVPQKKWQLCAGEENRFDPLLRSQTLDDRENGVAALG